MDPRTGKMSMNPMNPDMNSMTLVNTKPTRRPSEGPTTVYIICARVRSGVWTGASTNPTITVKDITVKDAQLCHDSGVIDS